MISTHVALPSRRKTQESVQSSLAPVIFLVDGLKLIWSSA